MHCFTCALSNDAFVITITHTSTVFMFRVLLHISRMAESSLQILYTGMPHQVLALESQTTLIGGGLGHVTHCNFWAPSCLWNG